MEQAERVDVVVDEGERACERYGRIILSASALLGIINAVMTTLPRISWFWNANFKSAYSIVGSWSVT